MSVFVVSALVDRDEKLVGPLLLRGIAAANFAQRFEQELCLQAEEVAEAMTPVDASLQPAFAHCCWVAEMVRNAVAGERCSMPHVRLVEPTLATHCRPDPPTTVRQKYRLCLLLVTIYEDESQTHTEG